MSILFEDFFHAAMGTDIDPYPYQIRLANDNWPVLVNIPTGMGKTAGVVLGWLYKRQYKNHETPRRLIYCLPMRVLVEQTVQNTRRWIDNLINCGLLTKANSPEVYQLMGGEVDEDWDRSPEREAIIIGTQDMLLSRALNRGYAMSRFRWPVQFGLLNSDCLWVMDEIQLMGSGLATTAQLQAFREVLGTTLPVVSIWMSATLQQDWLHTVDFADTARSLSTFSLSDEDTNSPGIHTRLNCTKKIEKADCTTEKPNDVAQLIIDSHQKQTRTLVVVNTVRRAMEIYQALKRKKPKADLSLLHSRFRPPDRKNALEKVLKAPGPDGSICVSTQVVEAGVDFSSTTLITELAPWASLVQRFGRCNRYGMDKDAKVIWLDVNLSKKGAALPYLPEELAQAAEQLGRLKDVCPAKLPAVPMKAGYSHVIRKRDLMDLFDTTPDLSGMDIDISRFIREFDDHDCQVFWRSLKNKAPSETELEPTRDELCSVSVSDLRALKDVPLWRWDHIEKRWERVLNTFRVAPGMVILINQASGCYSDELGWTGKKTDIPKLIEMSATEAEAIGDDPYLKSVWQSLADHSDMVVAELEDILKGSSIPVKYWEPLVLAARWHDAGKAHDVFQKAISGNNQAGGESSLWAKTAEDFAGYSRRGFRHELASALVMLERGLPDLPVFLAAAHHGKVRLSIRSFPNETSPGNPSIKFARGIWEGDLLPMADLGGGTIMPETQIDLAYMEMGDSPKGPSWLARMIALRDDHSIGPFRLGYYEALLRAADWRASGKVRSQDV